MDDGDPTRIRSLAVTVEDVVTAVELNRTTSRRAVLRVTPPFNGRMRARLHVVLDADSVDRPADTPPIHLDPEALLTADAPAYPTSTETEDELRDDPDETYTVDCHHERHVAAVNDWRANLADALCERITVQTSAGPHEIVVKSLGDPPTNEISTDQTKLDESGG